MAIHIKNILADGLLELCNDESLQSITVQQILTKTGVSRQSFYNHFKDKNDLIQYIYLTKMIPEYNQVNESMNFYESLLDTFQRMKKYHIFMKQACLMNDQNCLKDFMLEHCKHFDLQWYQKIYGSDQMTEALKFATEYHATASHHMTLSWILSDMPASCEDMAQLITQMRGIGMEKLFENAVKPDNPYYKK